MSEISSNGARGQGPERAAVVAAPANEACKVDFSTMCPTCQVEMQPVHSHYQCTRCGWRDSCCF